MISEKRNYKRKIISDLMFLRNKYCTDEEHFIIFNIISYKALYIIAKYIDL